MENVTISADELNVRFQNFTTTLTMSIDKCLSKNFDALADKLGSVIADSNKNTSNQLNGMFAKLGQKIDNITLNIPPQGNPVSPVPVHNTTESSAITKKLKLILEECMKEAGRIITEINSAELNKQIKIISEEMKKNSGYIAEETGKYFLKSADQLCNNINIMMNDFIEQIDEKNRVALSEVQKENNSEIQKLADSLDTLTKENINFKTTTEATTNVLTENLNSMIAHSDNFETILKEHIDLNATKTENVMEQQISVLLKNIENFERNNVSEFRNSMDDYQKKFIKSNAEALAGVQGNMLDAVTQTQNQLLSLAEKLQETIVSVEEYKKCNEKENSDLRETLKNYVNNIFGTFEIFKDDFKKFEETMGDNSRNNNRNILKRITEFTEKTYEIFDNIDKRLNKLSESVENSNQQLTNSIANYKDTLNEIRKSQREVHELNSTDLELFREALRR